MRCECCGDPRAGGRYCEFCDKLYFKGEKLRERTTERKKIEPKPRAKAEDRPCKQCDTPYSSHNKERKHCSACLKKMRGMNEKEKWLAKEEPKKRKRRDSNAVAYDFFRKKYSVPNNVFRG